MKLKKKLRAFFTLTRKANGGFTLVELIVVIAVLGILSGVGAVGYSGYVKKANKGNDKVLVGNIIRAIEIGTNSAMFVSDNSFALGDITYPVGFVALSTDSAAVIGSSTEIIKGETGEDCEFESLPDEVTVINFLGTKTVNCNHCDKTENVDLYKVDKYPAGTYSYCKTHSSGIPQVTNHPSGKSYVTGAGGFVQMAGYCFYNSSGETKSARIAKNAKVITPTTTDHFYAKTDSGICEYAYSHKHDSFGDTHIVGNVESGAIYDSLVAAFGSLDNLKLSYDGWTSDDGVDFATFYLAADDMMDSVETLGGNLATICGITDLLGKTEEFITRSYDSAEDYAKSFASTFTTTFQTYEQWETVWDAASGHTWSTEGFGLSGREYYSAARKTYNMGFASYLEANNVPSDVANVIADFSRSLGEDTEYADIMNAVGSLATFPALVNTSTFNDENSGLKEAINEAAAPYETAGGYEPGYYFGLCKNLYQKYITTPACKENGKVFYDTVVVMKDTESMATTTGDYFGYYSNYVDEISALYEAANNFSGNSVVIIVEVIDGVVQCRVSPTAANPREN